MDEVPGRNSLFQAILIGNYLPTSGFFYNAFGLQITYAMANLSSIGYLALFLFLRFPGFFTQLNLRFGYEFIKIFVYLSLFLIGHGSTHVDVSMLAGNMKNFEVFSESSRIAGLLKGFYGLSASVYVLFHLAGIRGSNYLMILSAANMLISLSGLFSYELEVGELAPMKHTERLKRKDNKLSILFIFQLCLMTYLFFINFSLVFMEIEVFIGSLLTAMMWVSFIVFMYWLAIVPKKQEEAAQQSHFEMKESIETEAEIDEKEELLQPLDESIDAEKPDEALLEGLQSNWKETVTSPKFYLLLFSFLVGTGTGLAVLSNANLIIRAKSGPGMTLDKSLLGALPTTELPDEKSIRRSTDIFLSLLSIANCLGRILVGYIVDKKLSQQNSDAFKKLSVDSADGRDELDLDDHKVDLAKSYARIGSEDSAEGLNSKRWNELSSAEAHKNCGTEKVDTREAEVLINLLSTSLLLMLFASFLLLFSGTNLSFLAAFIIGLSYGSFWTLSPSLVFNLFGNKYFGQNYSLMSFAPTLGSFLISDMISTMLYKAAYDSESTHIINELCYGNACFARFHQLSMVTLTIGICCSRVLKARM